LVAVSPRAAKARLKTDAASATQHENLMTRIKRRNVPLAAALGEFIR
jgi:hypothetical protein